MQPRENRQQSTWRRAALTRKDAGFSGRGFSNHLWRMGGSDIPLIREGVIGLDSETIQFVSPKMVRIRLRLAVQISVVNRGHFLAILSVNESTII
jgi:hypothetical protein